MKNIILMGLILFMSNGYSQTVPASMLELGHPTMHSIPYRINSLNFIKDYRELFNVPDKTEMTDYSVMSDYDHNEDLIQQILGEYQRIILHANIIHAFSVQGDIIELDLDALKHSKLAPVKEELKRLENIRDDMKQALDRARDSRSETKEFLCKKSFENQTRNFVKTKTCYKTLSYRTLFKNEEEEKRFDKLSDEYKLQKRNSYDSYAHYFQLINYIMVDMMKTNDFSKETFKNKLTEKLKYYYTVTQVPTKKNIRQRPIKLKRPNDYFTKEFVDLLYPLVSSQARKILESTAFEDKFETYLALEDSKQFKDDFLEVGFANFEYSSKPQFQTKLIEDKRRVFLRNSLASYINELKQKSGHDILKVVTNTLESQSENTEVRKTTPINTTQENGHNNSNAEQM